MVDITPPEAAKAAMGGLRVAQLICLIKDNQLVTALVLFVLWQAGAITQGVTALGGVC
jgi:hypothetical protein